MISEVPPPADVDVVWEAELRRLRQDEGEKSYEASAANGAGRSRMIIGPVVCVGCGGTIAPVLSRLGSTRCHDCRDGVRPGEPPGSTRAAGTPPPALPPAGTFLVRVRATQRRLRRREVGWPNS